MIWHYHWLILYEYLYKIMDWSVFDRILEEGCQYYTTPNTLPLEFTGAAFRMGHAQSREHNRINTVTEKKLMELGNFEKMEEYVDWRYIFNFGDGHSQFAKLMSPKLSPSFHQLPFVNNNLSSSLPFLNLKRGVIYGLPSGEDVAKRLGFDPLEIAETKTYGGTPLWYYILKEAALLGHKGEHLGSVGSTILGECFYIILQSDHQSFFKVHPKWKPNIGKEIGRFTFEDLVEFVA